MDIYDLISNAEHITKCKSTEENKYIMTLEKADFWDVYKESGIRDTFIIIDKKGEINFYIKLKQLDQLKDLLHSNNIFLDAEWNYNGPEIILNIDGLERIPGFIFEIQKNMDAFILKKFLKNQEIFVQYFTQDERGIIKLLTKKMQLHNNFIERLKYYIELDYYGVYPRIKDEKIESENGYYIRTDWKTSILQEVLDIAEKIEKKFTKGSITIHVEAKDFCSFIFSGDMQNIKLIIDKISKRVNIIEEGRIDVRGKPFLKYKSGLLYFY